METLSCVSIYLEKEGVPPVAMETKRHSSRKPFFPLPCLGDNILHFFDARLLSLDYLSHSVQALGWIIASWIPQHYPKGKTEMLIIGPPPTNFIKG